MKLNNIGFDNRILSLKDVNNHFRIINCFNGIVERNCIVTNSDVEYLCKYLSNYEILKVKDSYTNDKDNIFNVLKNIVKSYSDSLKVNYFNLGFECF